MEVVEEPEMSEYERFRAQNLQRNLEVLKMLGRRDVSWKANSLSAMQASKQKLSSLL